MQSIAAHQILGSHVRTCYRLLDGASRATCEGPCMDATYMSPRPARRMRAITANADVDGRPGMLPSSATCSVTLIVSCRSRSWADFLEGMGYCVFIACFASVSEVCSAECLRGTLVRQRSQLFSKISSTTLRLIALGDRALRSHSATDRFCRASCPGACFFATCTPPMRAQTAHLRAGLRRLDVHQY